MNVHNIELSSNEISDMAKTPLCYANQKWISRQQGRFKSLTFHLFPGFLSVLSSGTECRTR